MWFGPGRYPGSALRESVEDSYQAAYVVRMGVRGQHEVQGRDAVVLEVRFNTRSHLRFAPIDDCILAVELQQLGVALAHVEKVNGQVLVSCCRGQDQKDSMASCRRCFSLGSIMGCAPFWALEVYE